MMATAVKIPRLYAVVINADVGLYLNPNHRDMHVGGAVSASKWAVYDLSLSTPVTQVLVF